MCYYDVVLARRQLLCCHLVDRVLMCFVQRCWASLLALLCQQAYRARFAAFCLYATTEGGCKEITTHKDVMDYMTSTIYSMCSI